MSKIVKENFEKISIAEFFFYCYVSNEHKDMVVLWYDKQWKHLKWKLYSKKNGL